MPNDSDAELVKKYLAGDQNALNELYGTYIPSVFNFISRLAPDGTDVENLTQEAFVKAWTNLKRYDAKRPFKTWLFTIAKNTLFDELKKKRPINFTAMKSGDGEKTEMDVADDRPLPEELMIRAEADARVGDMLKRLSPRQSAVVVLHVIEGMTFAEIGEVLSEPMDTVKTRYRRGIASLNKNLLDGQE